MEQRGDEGRPAVEPELISSLPSLLSLSLSLSVSQVCFTELTIIKARQHALKLCHALEFERFHLKPNISSLTRGTSLTLHLWDEES